MPTRLKTRLHSISPNTATGKGGHTDEEILSKVRLAVISMVMVSLMLSAESEADRERCAVLAKNYSKEIEYSEENLETVYDMTYTEAVFSPESLSSFFE